MARLFALLPHYPHLSADLFLQVRLIAAQLVALVEKVGDKDKVRIRIEFSILIPHMITHNAGAAFQEEHKTTNPGDD